MALVWFQRKERSTAMKLSNGAFPDACQKPMKTSPVRTADARWKGLYIVGGIAALMIGLFFVIEIIGVSATGLPPTTVIGWFTLLQHDWLRGLFDLFLLDMVSVALYVPLYLALYVALRRDSPSFIALATILVFIGIAVYFASNTAFSMLSFSSQYAAATTDAQRSFLLAAGQGALAGLAQGSGAGVYVAFTFNALAGLIISGVMLHSKVFGNITAAVGILGNVLELGPPGVLVPASFYSVFVSVEVVLVGIGGVLLVVWYLLIARRLFQLAQGRSKEETKLPAIS
jgi:hypothetical protein